MSSSAMVCTSDRFARRAEGKASGLERVTTVLEDVSGSDQLLLSLRMHRCSDLCMLHRKSHRSG